MSLETGTLVHVRINGRLGRVVGLVSSDGDGEAVYEVKMTDDNSTLRAGESSLGDSSELTPAELAADVAEETPTEEVAEEPAAEPAAPSEPAPTE
jgi:hypothetical protein